jgi:dipeptidyl aminopeptidase/acylaminoacyl peptidase
MIFAAIHERAKRDVPAPACKPVRPACPRSLVPRTSPLPRPALPAGSLAVLLLVSALAPAGAATAQSASPAATEAPTFERLQVLADAANRFREVAISPDGHRVSWAEKVLGVDGLAGERTALFVARLDAAPGAGARPAAAEPRRITPAATGAASAANAANTANAGGDAATSEHSPAWSPDGERLAFLSTARAAASPAATPASGPDQLQLWVADLRTGTSRPLTHLDGFLDEPRWSPDGREIAFLYIAGRRGQPGPTHPTEPDAGVVGETPKEQRLVVVDLASAAVERVSPADLFVYEYDWSPDGSAFAATAAPGAGDDNWWIAELITLPRRPGAAHVLLKPPFQMANPRFSPDGRTIAIIGGLMSDQGVTGGDLYLVPATGGAARDLTPDLKASISWLAWTAAGELLCEETADDATVLAAIDPRSGAARRLWSASETIGSGAAPGPSLARDGRTSAVVRHAFAAPPEIWAGPLGAWSQITHIHADLRPAWGEAKSLHWQSDGATVQGWLLAPPRVEAGRKYPLLVQVHGGPASAQKPSWPGLSGALASQGFFVLLPNPRGSYGQGEAFTRGNVKDFGYGDLRDILAGVDAAIAAAPIDGTQVGLLGWSYGGYMTMWAVTQTHRFRAAVAGAGIANWQSYYGENGIDQWMIPYFGASVYDDPWIYERSSPITFIRNVTTPTLVLQGERDAEVPAPQSYEFWHALRTLGVETQLVIFPGEGHHLQPASDRDRVRRTVAWFKEHLR